MISRECWETENCTEYYFKYALKLSQMCTQKILSVPHNT